MPSDPLGPVDHPFEPIPWSAIETSVFRRFEETAERHAGRLALQDCTTALTYSEVAALVRRIAGLTGLTVGEHPGPLAILLRSEARFPAAILAACGLGRAYIPLDAGAPIARNRAIATGAAAILSADDLIGDAQAIAAPGVKIIDIADGEIAATDRDWRAAPSHPLDPVGIIPTSGSTGASKGVVFCQRNVMQIFMQYTNVMHLSCQDRVMLAYSLHAAASVRTVFSALLNGASLHILPPRQLGPEGLVREIRARDVTIYYSPPTLLRRIDEVLAPGERLDSVRAAKLGSERIEWRDVDLCRRRFAEGAPIYMGLDSTETAGGFCQWFVDDAVRGSCRQPPVGRPLPERRVTIVGDDGLPVPDGETGEIVVSSRYLALGYWRGLDHSIEPFPTDPTDPDRRVLRTGDLGFRRPDGLIEFLGRRDHIIKLHGQRIDCAEVEAALGALPAIGEAAVLVRKTETGVPQALVAYVALRPGHGGLLGRHVQSLLAYELPRYMVPSRVFVMEQLPRSSNLKIDRVRLAALDAEQKPDLRDRAQDALIDEVARLFEMVLEVSGASADDNVQSLNGDSMQAIALTVEIERNYAVVMPDELTAEYPSIRTIANWLRSQTSQPEARSGMLG